ncbi:hypothetical protein [Quadrisphaera sp. INWT6]|uniref:hypothetical protein n=1 Tax=Quadrisphaera sp. INWT6 TaxID=2596917 RepID=UPI00189256BC|nr:hypothetical protein [Quadrisphaera sp. INWT6]MBF5080980.1 hypothetical protein [Quadrisphaera sp. INWT6]
MSGYSFPGTGGGPSFDPSEGAHRAVVVLPVASAERAADLCALGGVAATCVPVSGAGVVVVPDAREGVGPGLAGVDAAERTSRLLRGVDVVLLLVGGGDGAGGAPAPGDGAGSGEGQVDAQTWRGGQQATGGRPAGLLLATWHGDVLRLLLGRLDPADAAGAVSSAGRGRWSAVRSLLRPRRTSRG